METIERFLADSEDRTANARVQAYRFVFIERFARERLRALAQSEGRIMKDVPEVLFVCVYNAGRSQMAAALLHLRGQGRVHVRSAGGTPADEINPAVIAAMDELGLDLSREFPEPLTDEVVRAADVVVTLGGGNACPIYPAKRYLDWGAARSCRAKRRRSPGHPRRHRRQGAGTPGKTDPGRVLDLVEDSPLAQSRPSRRTSWVGADR